ncbi:MAG TPA: hypothetical protein ENJ64_01100 [Thiotrichales bacterium]|nr:hypothetical protein [Thiotrichales bacterium]
MDLTDWVKDNSWVLAPAFIIVLALIVIIKAKLANKVEIKPVDVGIALIPFILWMATAGIFKKVEVPGILSLETADVIVSAAAAPIKLQVSKMPVTALRADAKRGVEEIPEMLHNGTQILSFKLGYSGYYGPAIWMYFNNLVASPAFRYAIITDKNGALFGLFDARRLTTLLNPENNIELMKKFPLKPYEGTPSNRQVQKWRDFARTIAQADKTKLAAIPGFVPLSMAVKPDADKKRVLEQMEQKGLDWLPVVTEKNGIDRFQGIVERSRLTASLILDITEQLESSKKSQEK